MVLHACSETHGRAAGAGGHEAAGGGVEVVHGHVGDACVDFGNDVGRQARGGQGGEQQVAEGPPRLGEGEPGPGTGIDAATRGTDRVDEAAEDAEATAAQVVELARAGSELVRITVNTAAAAARAGP